MLARKLKSNRGMSIVMGLLLLLVCITAGTAALTAAASNAGRYTHLRQDQQRYLTVASAARLVRDELCAGKYTAEATLTETYIHYSTTNAETGEVTWHTRGPEYALEPLKDSGYTGSFSGWLQSHMDKAGRGQIAASDWWSLAGQAKPAGSGSLTCDDLSVQVDGVDSQVKWRLEMEEDYSIRATFKLVEGGSTYYATTLTIPAKVSFDETMSNSGTHTRTQTTTTRTMTVEWPEAGAVIRQS